MKQILVICLASVAFALGCAWFANAPFLGTLVGTLAIASSLPFIGLLITLDEFLPGGWDNLDGRQPFPYRLYLVAAGVPLCLWLVFFAL